MPEDKKTILQKIKLFFKKRSVLVGILIIIIILIIIVKSGKDTSDTPPLTVSQHDLVKSVTLRGIVAPAKEASLGFTRTGKVKTIFVTTNQKVKKGDILMKLDASTQNADLADAKGSLNIAIAKRNELTRGTRATDAKLNEVSLDTSVMKLDDVKALEDSKVQNAHEILLSSGLEALWQNQGTVQSMTPTISGTYEGSEGDYYLKVFHSAQNSGYSFTLRGLETDSGGVVFGLSVPLGTKGLYVTFPQGIYTSEGEWKISIPNKKSSSYLENLNAYQTAIKNRDLAITNAQGDISKSTASVNIDKAGSSSEQIQIANGEIQRAQAQVERINATINDGIIRAPFSGIVTNIIPNEGEIIQSGETAISILGENGFEVQLKTLEIDSANLFVGQEAKIVFDALPNTEPLTGTIRAINSKETIENGVPTYITYVTLPVTDTPLRSGLNCKATIILDHKEHVISIPKYYIFQKDSKNYVYKLINEKPVETQVEVGIESTDGLTEITSGIQEGDLIQEPAV